MIISEQVNILFDSETESYFKMKQHGGMANQKGSRYEDFFSIMKLAQLSSLINLNTNPDIEIKAQAEAFVDDLLISDTHHNSQRHFQLKNTSNIKWGTGLRSISDDFYKQKSLNDSGVFQASCRLNS